MKKYLILIHFLFGIVFATAQTTETFESEPDGSTTFTDNGQLFNIISGNPAKPYYIQASYPGTGWNGSSNDNRYIDNDNFANFNTPTSVTIATAGGPAFYIKSFWLYLSTNDPSNLNVDGTVTITGKLGGNTVFTVTKSSPFNTSLSTYNGFTLFNMSDISGTNVSNVLIDQYTVSTTSGINYVSLDAMTWQCAPVTVISSSQNNVSCAGGNNGTATVSVSSGAVTYNWAPGTPPGDGTATVTGLTAGTWTCTITSSCGTTATKSFTITAPEALTASQSQTNILCYGASTGTASVVASGGTASYSYAWLPSGGNAATATGLATGNYTVTITDANGCSIQKSFTITQPSTPLNATQSQTNILCNGLSTGTASVIASGGTGSYSYAWLPSGGNAATATGLAAGNYTLTITDANGCSTQKSFTITQPSTALAATQSQTNVLCNGSSTGTAGVVASGGTEGYNYAWSPSGGNASTATGLAAGNYMVTVTDANGCSLQKSFTITQPSAVTAIQSQTNILCNGASTGTASVLASGGAGTYSYAWSPSGGAAATASGLSAGNYTVTVTDANGCSIQKSFTITQPSAVTAIQSQTDVQCYGASTGTAGVSPSGGTGGYTYEWLPSGGNAATASGLSAGSYTVTITDANGCSTQKSFTITQPATALTATQSQTNILCNGSSTGTASVVAAGGTGSYSYSWSPSGGNAATATGLMAGTYAVTIFDGNGCSIEQSFTITQPSAITAIQSQTNVLCYSTSTGTASVSVSGGSGSYGYVWSPSGGNAATATGLAAGSYTVTISDANGCSAQKIFNITEPSQLSATQSQTNVVCSNTGTGSASVSPSGGAGGYTYYWYPSEAITSSISGLYAGYYIVTITDANGCSIQKEFLIAQPTQPFTASQSQTDVLCNGGSTGTATVEPSGGTGPYTYSWSPSGGNEATATGLAAGDYIVTIIDANGCIQQRYFTITEPSALSAEIAPTSTGCEGTATATVYASGGVGYYTYQWSPSGGNQETATGLEPGTYTVTVTDANGCSVEASVNVAEGSECSTYTYWNGFEWDNGAPSCFNVTAVIFGDYNSALHGEITACTLMVNAGTVVVEPGDTFTIKGSVYLEGGSLIFENNSNLVQIDNVSNYGNIIYKRNSSLLYGYDYTLWSSPLSGNQTLKDFSPQTLDERFYVYNTVLGAYSNYMSASGIFGGNPNEETFDTGKGYLIRMPDGLSENATSVFSGVFTGTPNNGDITVPLEGSGTRYNAIGNPYPSPVNIKDFLLSNSDQLDNGTLYFWRKRNGSSGTAYATVTLAAYVAATAEGGDTSAGAFEDGNEDNWVINPGQGFQVKAAPMQNFVVFDNSMRRAVNNGQFFKTGSTNALPQDVPSTSKMWLNITNQAGEFGQAALVYNSATTAGLDYGYDGRLFNDGTVAVYTMVADTRLSVQSRGGFETSDEVAVGYKTTTAGDYTISLDHVTGIFTDNEDVYLRDNLLDITHNLTTLGGYSFSTETGTINDRFSIVYATELDVTDHAANSNNVVVYKHNNVISISSTSNIDNVRVFDLRGRMLSELKGINTQTAQITGLTAQQQMLVVQVTTTEGYTVSKKIIY